MQRHSVVRPHGTRSGTAALIQRQEELEVLCDRLQENPPLAFDTEFIRERRYWPRLCLIQVSGGGGEPQALIDPFAVQLRPLIRLLADPAIEKICHAGGQDLQILAQMHDCAVHPVFDTQIAAAFLGYGHQIGYTDLVARLLGGPALSKASQYTDWAARPLSADQMEYALDDVRYLPPLYRALKSALEQRGRLRWAEAEFRRLEERSLENTPPEELYQKLNTAGMSRKQLGALRELAAARDAIAQDLDRPVTHVLPDAAMIQMAKQPPASTTAMRGMRGMPALPGEQSQRLLVALGRAASLPADQLPSRAQGERPEPLATAIAALLGAVVQARAAEQEVSRTYLAPADQLSALADWWVRRGRDPARTAPAIPLLEDWRRELIGEDLLRILEGEVAIALDPSARRTGALESVLRLVKPAP